MLRRAGFIVFLMWIIIPVSHSEVVKKDKPTTELEGTHKSIVKNGELRCGVTTGLVGFSYPTSEGRWSGLDVDICRAVAVAILGHKDKVKFIPLSAQQRFVALQSGEVDILSRVTTKTLSRDTSLSLNFAPITFYDGQAFMVRKSDKINSAKELDGASVCTQQGTTTELNLVDFFSFNAMKLKPVIFESEEEVVQAFLKGRCDAYTTDSSGLAAERSRFKRPQDYLILPEIISKEPLAPAVRHGDDKWFDLVSYSVNALFLAEELGLNSKNIEEFKNTKNPNIQRFLGIVKGNGRSLGLEENWAYNIIKQVGNYGEIFDRNVGKSSPLNLARGLNASWKDGGLQYSPPFR